MDEKSSPEPVIVLTIAGSDSGGAAGLQADLKTFTRLKVYGMSVITAVTAQNSLVVKQVYTLPIEFVIDQLATVLADYGAVAIKTGYIGRADLVEAVAAELAGYQPRHLVVDPVLVNHRGESMFSADVISAYQNHLLPLADIVTPNQQEALLLSQSNPSGAVIQRIHAFGSRWVLLKGTLMGQEIIDTLSDGHNSWTFTSPYQQTKNTHGSGDTLSAAICAFLACDYGMVDAVAAAHRYTAAAINNAVNWRIGAGHGPINHLQ